MIKLNLTNPEKSEVPYKVSKFPDGQQSITVDTKLLYHDLPVFPKEVTISSRMNSFKDVELIICANQALREAGVKEVHLYVPYFIGARSDRKFLEGTSNYLKTVICPIINLQKFASVTVMDPHSDVLEMGLNNYKKIPNFYLVKFALEDIQKDDSDVTVISPDAGALKKIYDVMEHQELEKLIVASKHRDVKTGKITHTDVPGLDDTPGRRNFVIIDDICDGGRTFVELAKAIRAVRNRSIFNDRIYLIVTHGIFSAGFDELSQHFHTIYCTNSIENIECDGTALSYSRGAQVVSRELVKQLNVF
jgi:ribose-phosphate pyrophosphokinase